MESDKRKGLLAIPKQLDVWLNEEQKDMLSTIEGYGWELKYVRRPNGQKPIVIVVDSAGVGVGTLEEDGSLDLDSGVVLR